MKVSNALLKTALIKNGGIYARAARWLEQVHDIKITRAAIQRRAIKWKGFIEEIDEVNVDWAESALNDIIRTSTDERVKLQAVKFYLSTRGKSRGYLPTEEKILSGKVDLADITGVRIIPDNGDKPKATEETT